MLWCNLPTELEEVNVQIQVMVHLLAKLKRSMSRKRLWSYLPAEVHEQNQVVVLLDNKARDLVQVVVMVLLDNMADEVFMQVEVVVFDNTELRRSMQRQRFRGSCTR